MTPRLLNLGFAWPPGMQALYPGVNPAGHRFETQLMAELCKDFQVRSVGILPVPLPPAQCGGDPASGVQHDLLLEERPPHLWHRYRSLLRLKRVFGIWQRADWRPDAILSLNFSPVYNGFIAGLKRERPSLKRVLLLADSSQLGTRLPWSKRWRYRLKPLVIPHDEMLRHFDGCIGLSRDVQKHLSSRMPFLWMPGACSASSPLLDQVQPDAAIENRPVRFGYFGALAEHAGILEFARIFLNLPLSATLHICGYGKLSDELAGLAQGHPRLRFKGLFPRAEDCFAFGRDCDVLINPRPATHGNANNFPSKVFDYALCGRSMLSTRLSGVESVLGEAAFYFDADQFEASLPSLLIEIAKTPLPELHRRGAIVQAKVCAEYTWPQQGARINEFIKGIIAGNDS